MMMKDGRLNKNSSYYLNHDFYFVSTSPLYRDHCDMPVGAKSPHGSLFCQSHRLSVYMLPICNTYSSTHVENAI